MRPPRVRITVKGLMVLIAALALILGWAVAMRRLSAEYRRKASVHYERSYDWDRKADDDREEAARIRSEVSAWWESAGAWSRDYAELQARIAGSEDRARRLERRSEASRRQMYLHHRKAWIYFRASRRPWKPLPPDPPLLK